MEIKLAGSKISNYEEMYSLGTVYEVPIKGIIEHKLNNAYVTIENGKMVTGDEHGAYAPVSNGIGADNKKYVVFASGNGAYLSGFQDDQAYVDPVYVNE